MTYDQDTLNWMSRMMAEGRSIQTTRHAGVIATTCEGGPRPEPPPGASYYVSDADLKLFTTDRLEANGWHTSRWEATR